MNNTIEAIVVLLIGIGLQVAIYEIEPTDNGLQYSTSEATYLWPRTLVEERSTKEEAQ